MILHYIKDIPYDLIYEAPDKVGRFPVRIPEEPIMMPLVLSLTQWGYKGKQVASPSSVRPLWLPRGVFKDSSR